MDGDRLLDCLRTEIAFLKLKSVVWENKRTEMGRYISDDKNTSCCMFRNLMLSLRYSISFLTRTPIKTTIKPNVVGGIFFSLHSTLVLDKNQYKKNELDY